MPEPTNEVQEEVESAAPGEETAEDDKKGSSLLVWLLPLILMPAVGGAYFAYTQYTTIAQAAVTAGLDVGFSSSNPEEEPIEYGQFTTIEDLLINPAGSDGKRFLVVSLGLEAKSAGILAELETKDIVVRDAVLRLLSERTAEELAAIDKREEIKDQILQELNSVLQTGTIERLYFTQFLLQ